MRVLLVSPNFYPKVGGIESHLFEVLHNLAGIQFTVLTNWQEGVERHATEFPGIEFAYVWPTDRSLRRLAQSQITIFPYRLLISGVELLRTANRIGWMNRLNFDLIHVHYLNMDQLDRNARRLGFGALIPRWYRWISARARRTAPVLFTDHTVFTALEGIVPRMTIQALLRSFNNIISVDRGSFDVVRAYQRAHGGRSWFIPNSVDTDRFTARGPSPNGFTVGYAARLGKLGENLLHKALRDLGDKVNWHFAIAGEQVDLVRSQLRKLCPRARFFENLDYTKMPEFYSSLDVMINPFPGEGVGRTILEAMSCGVAVIGVGTGDKYPLRSDETGFLVPPDSQAISTQVRELMIHPELAQSVGKRAREVIAREFSNRVLLPRLREVYDTVAG